MNDEEIENGWEFILRKHWLRLIPFILIITAAFISGIYVFLWHNEIGLGFGTFWTYTFNDWTFGLVVVYVLFLILREFLLVGLPTLAVLGIIFGIMWYSLSLETREVLKAWNKREEEKKKSLGKRASGGASGCTFLVTIVFLIIMALNGKWNTPFGNMDFQYFVITYIQALIWVAIIFGIPVLIGGIAYLVYKYK